MVEPLSSSEDRTCVKCNEVKDLDSFYRTEPKTTNMRRMSTCKACFLHKQRGRWLRLPIETRRRYNQRTPEEARRLNMWAKYRITTEEFDAMSSAQDHVCAICKSAPVKQKFLVVDHCHTTGFIRGLLCNPCNTWLGRIKDDPTAAMRAVRYLEERRPT